MRALITGVTGQDGGYLAERLIDNDYQVHGLVRPGDDVSELLRRSPGVVLHEGDLTDEQALAAALRAADADEIFHLAGISSVAFSWEQPLLTADVTGLGAARLLELAWRQQERSGRPVRYLQAASAEIFGNPAQVPQTERTPIRPTSPYGAAKAYTHHLAGVYRSRGLAAVSLVLYNHESPRRPPTFVTRKITQAAARISLGQQSELSLGTLEVRRDWGWAPDYVDAMVRAVRAPAEDWVVATGEAHSVGEFVQAAFERAGVEDWSALVHLDPRFARPTDSALQVGDATRIREQLGWAPTVAFPEIVGRMVDADLELLRAV